MSFTQSRSVKDILSNTLSDLKDRRARLDWYQLQIEQDKEVTDYSILAVEKVIKNCGVIAGRAHRPQRLTAPATKPEAVASPEYNGNFQQLAENIQSAMDSAPKPVTKAQCRPTRLKGSNGRPALQENGKFYPGELIVAAIWEIQNAGRPLTRQDLLNLLGVADNRGLTMALNKAVRSRQIEVDGHENGLEHYSPPTL